MLNLIIMSLFTMLLHLLRRCLAIFGRFRLAWEQDEAGLVGLEALDVGCERFFGEVLSARIDGDADCRSQLAWYAGFL
jgi:hypothetical protein